MKKVFKQIGKAIKYCLYALAVAFWVFFFYGIGSAVYETATDDSIGVNNDSATVNTLAAVEHREPKKHNGYCLARTNKGTPCKRKAKPGYYYCWQHLKTYN